MIKTAISFLLGAWVLLQFNQLPDPAWLWLWIAAFILLLTPQTRLFAVFLLGFLWTFYHAQAILDDRLTAERDNTLLLVFGKVASLPEKNEHRIRFVFEPDPQFTSDLPDKIDLSWYAPYPQHLHADSRWQLKIKIKPIHGMHNPGSFDYEAWNFIRQVGARGYVRYSTQNKELEPAPLFSVNVLREHIQTALSQTLATSPFRGLITALTIGARDQITRHQWQILRQTGTSHLVAISGLHISLAAAIGFFLLRFLWSRRSANLLLLPAHEFAAIGGLLFAIAYAALAGFSIPTQRALIMVAVAMLSLLSRRPVMVTDTLALALLLVLLWQPLAVLSAGFWLSFAAVALILFISQHRFPHPRWQGVYLHGLIAIGLTPFLLLFFQQSALIAPVANLLAIPFISLIIVPLLLLSLLMLWLYPPVAAILLQLTDTLFAWFWPLMDTLAALDMAYWESAPLPADIWLVLLTATLLCLLPRGFPGRYLAIAGLFPLLFYTPEKPDRGTFRFTLLDVGQGLAAVVQTHSHVLVFDTGPRFSTGFNTGTAVVKPFLTYHGLKAIDTMIISHGDNDHIGGARSLLHTLPVHRILSSVPEQLPAAGPCLLGQSWLWEGVTFQLLNPAIDDAGSDNNLSCVLKVSTGAHSILLTGDIEKETEQRLIDRYGPQLQATVLIAPHHGSNTSSSAAFIAAVRPDRVWFPAGYHNRYHFPSAHVLSRYRQLLIPMRSTADSGALTVTVSADHISPVTAWRQAHRRIWSASQ